MRYWCVEIEYPTWCEGAFLYFEANSEEAANQLASEITEDEASNMCYWYSDDPEEQEYFVENTTFKLTEVSYEEAKDHI